jgi:hypothetical protein
MPVPRNRRPAWVRAHGRDARAGPKTGSGVNDSDNSGPGAGQVRFGEDCLARGPVPLSGAASWDVNRPELAGLDGGDLGTDCVGGGEDAAELVRGQLDDGDRAAGEVLLGRRTGVGEQGRTPKQPTVGGEKIATLPAVSAGCRRPAWVHAHGRDARATGARLGTGSRRRRRQQGADRERGSGKGSGVNDSWRRCGASCFRRGPEKGRSSCVAEAARLTRSPGRRTRRTSRRR